MSGRNATKIEDLVETIYVDGPNRQESAHRRGVKVSKSAEESDSGQKVDEGKRQDTASEQHSE